ncbi:MAG: hypothetical protein AAF958_19430 [Planctomycetota bacterium]
MNSNGCFILNCIATWYMVGLIWMVQVVHYNLMDRVGTEGFATYETEHSRLITPIVAIPMLIELLTAAVLLWQRPTGFPLAAAWVGFGCVILLWLSTAFLQVPYHGQLTQGFSQSAYEGLVRTNWIRTVLWSFRGAMLAYFLYQVLTNNTQTINIASP